MSYLTDTISQLMLQLRQDIITASEQAGQRASGKTYDNITTVVQQEGDTTVGELWAPEYFYTLLRGRGPGNVPADMTDIISEWAAYKGITFSTPEEALRFANAVAWKIRREGSELYRNHLYIDIVDTPVRIFEENIDRLLGSVMDVSITAAFNGQAYEGHGYIL